MEFIACIERATGRCAAKRYLPAQPGDVPVTYANVTSLETEFGFRPDTPLEQGVANFVAWYRDYYHVSSAPTKSPSPAPKNR